jgi:replicative DNA helicase
MSKIPDVSSVHQSAELLDRGPPHEAEAERAVLGCAIMLPAKFGEIAATLAPEDFFDEINRAIFAGMLRLHRHGRPIDATLLIGELRDHGQLSADHTCVTFADLAELFRWHPAPDHLPYYLARIAELSRRRQAFLRGVRLIQAANSGFASRAIPSAAIRRATLQAIDRRIKRCKGAGR